MTLLLGDCLETMKTLADNSVDAVVTDPPYGLAFMNKKWDYDVPSRDVWAQVYRVMKPGAHLLSFGGTRTYHRMVVAIEDAGFEIRDQVMWIYGSGFPKSLDVSKAIDKAAGAEREVVGQKFWPTRPNGGAGKTSRAYQSEECTTANDEGINITAPATDAAKQWQGWGTALKPANEPIVLARKPLEKGLTVAQNVLKYGTGALNVDAGRIGYASEADKKLGQSARPSKTSNANEYALNHGGLEGFDRTDRSTVQGRWPANVLFDEEAAAVLDAQSGVSKSTQGKKAGGKTFHGVAYEGEERQQFGDSGGASRFFYVAKTSKRERNAGLEGMPGKFTATMNDGIGAREHNENQPTAFNANHHPTVKPIKLMEYLCKLITPSGGVVLDPFMGSGSTGCAARALGFDFIGCEMSEEYFEIAKRRIEHWESEAA